MSDLVGTLAMVASLTIIILGLPAQIIKNFRRKSTEGLAHSLVYSACATYTLWGLYGWIKPDLFLKIAQTPGIVLSYTLLFQIFYYKYKRHKTEKEI